MKRYCDYPHNSVVEEIVGILVRKTGNSDKRFFRILTTFFLSQVASNMRCNIQGKYMGTLPVNFYGVSLATSGYGKGYSTSIITNRILGGFRKRFLEETLPFISEYWLDKIATKVAATKGTDYSVELKKVEKEYADLGEFVFQFDSGSTPALKQLRIKMLLARIGALSFVADEIGSNILEPGVIDLIHAFKELYDTGHIGDKLTKNTKDNIRIKQIFGACPANMFLFGTPSKLFDGTKAEDKFRSLLASGLSRRCFFAYSDRSPNNLDKSPEQIYRESTADIEALALEAMYDLFTGFADPAKYAVTINVPEAIEIELIAYRQHCQKLSSKFSEQEEEKKAELDHRYFKTIKLAGVFAFIDDKTEVNTLHLHNAIRASNDSGKTFQRHIIQQDKPHTKLLKYLIAAQSPVTYADMKRDLTNFPTNIGGKQEIFTLAASEGYLNNITITHYLDNDIDLFTADKLAVTKLTEIKISYSEKTNTDFVNDTIDFSNFSDLVALEEYRWCNHHFDDGYRSETSCDTGFNVVVVTLPINTCIDLIQSVLSDLVYFIYEDNSEDGSESSIRLVLPLSNIVHLNSQSYNRFMHNVYEWLPFMSEEHTANRSYAFMTNSDGNSLMHSSGLLLDAQLFIPQTTKATNLNKLNKEIGDVNPLEKWFLRKVQNNSLTRNAALVKYGFALVSEGMKHSVVMEKIDYLNDRLDDPLKAVELLSTISIKIQAKIDE